MNCFKNDSLRLLQLGAELEVESPLVWGSFPGSVIHGALGFVARKRSCVLKRDDCTDCFLLETCFYSQLFESRPPKETDRMKKYLRIPPGLRLTMEPWQSDSLRSGDLISVGMTLYGSTIAAAMSVFLALEEAFVRGIGSKSNQGERGTAFISQFDGGTGEKIDRIDIDHQDIIPIKVAGWDELELPERDSFAIEFTSPARIVSGGRITAEPSFRDIFVTAMRRVSNIAYFYCGVELEADYRKLVELAEETSYESDFQVEQLSRYSARQKNRQQMNGITGKMHVGKCPEELRPWLVIGERLGVGKNTSMGYGVYKIV